MFFNAVPLFVLAAAYLAVAAALAPRLWRERARLRVNDLALALMFPCIGIPLASLAPRLLLADARARGQPAGPADEQEHRGREGDEDRGEREPQVARERPAVG